MMERDSLRKERLDQVQMDIQYGIESGTAAAWNAEEIEIRVRKRRVATKAG